MCQCNLCKGTGFIKYETKKCEKCNGLKCMHCKESGYEFMPYDTCYNCDGSGSGKSSING